LFSRAPLSAHKIEGYNTGRLERVLQPIFRVIARSPSQKDDEAISKLDVKNNGEIASLRSQ